MCESNCFKLYLKRTYGICSTIIKIGTLACCLVSVSCNNDDLNCPASNLIDTTPASFPVDFSCREIDPMVQEEYLLDAYFLATMLMNRDPDDSMRVLIPQEYVENILKALTTVFSYSDLQNDSLKGFGIKSRMSTEGYFTNIFLWLSGNESSFEAWATEGYPTPSCELNALIESFDLRLQSFDIQFEPSSRKTARISSDKALNVQALSRYFLLMEEVLIAEPSYILIGDGISIRTWLEGENLKLEFIYGWGDCPSGCIYQKIWTYTLNSDCAVTDFEYQPF